MCVDSETTIYRYLAATQKTLYISRAKVICWRSLLTTLAFGNIFLLLAFCLDFPRQCYLTLLFIPIVAACWLLKRVDKSVAACFLDRELQLEQGVISSYRLLSSSRNNGFSKAIIDSVAGQLTQAIPEANKLREARQATPAGRAMGLVLVLVGLTLQALPQILSVNKPAKANVNSAVSFSVEDIAQLLQNSGEIKLARQFANTGRKWQRGNVSREAMRRQIDQMMRLLKSRRRTLEKEARKFQQAQRLLAGYPSGRLQRFVSLPRTLKNLFTKQLNIFQSKLATTLPRTANTTTRVGELLRTLHEKKSRQSIALRQPLASLARLSRSIKSLGGTEDGNQAGEGISVIAKSPSLSGASGEIASPEHWTSLSFPKSHKKILAESYLKKNWWPRFYHPAVLKYFNAKNRSR